MLQKPLKSVLGMAAIFAALFAGWGTNASAADQYVVQYRLAKWKTAHFHDSAKAEAHLATLKTLRCEVKSGGHDGHIDVSYRCPEWRSLAVKTDAGAHKWEKWLRASGFETAHEH